MVTQQPQPLADLHVLDLIQVEHDHQPATFQANGDMHAPRLLAIAQALRAELQQAQQQTAQLAALLRAGQTWRAGRLVAESRYSATEIRAIFGWPEPTRDGAPTETTHACAAEYCDEFDPATCLVTPAAVSGA